ncbi:MAG: peptidase MA family metallohydrolase [Isosphaerales bacterium]
MLASAAQRESPRCGRGRRSRIGPLESVALLVCLSLSRSAAAFAADLEEAEKLFRTGRYDECARVVDEEIGNDAGSEPWHHLKVKTELARGKDAEAIASLEGSLRHFPASVSLHLLARDVYRVNGRDQDAATELDAIERLVQGSPRRYATADGLVTIGRFFLLRGADARKVLDQFYDVVTKQQPDFAEAYFATAEMALDKEDYALAAETLRKAPKTAALDPRFHYLHARALSAQDRAGTALAISEALKINPRHVDSLLLQTDQLIDGERYAEADQVLKRIFDVNPREPRAFAYQAVLAHLRGDGKGEESARRRALERWASNPEVDHLIGRKLSEKYRFAEGSARQRQALAMDPDYQPAKTQLCQDLLRLGTEDEGWKLAAEIFSKDAYNVVAYNLITLRDRLSGFRTLQDDGFIVRMDVREADLYGQRVLALLRRARKTLGEKYGVTIPEPVIVEIFPQRKEFAVRTFGLPGAEGFLGVCFGRVVTANSPASQGEHPSNWEAVLWHEFCHVITLNKTLNKMPRWLSEGISVYEEGRQDPSWATALNPNFRAMILGDALTPLSRLSSAFLAPKTPLHLQFAYFESAQAVDFIVQKFGMPALKGLLDDLGAGMSLNEALPRRTKMSLDQIDADFTRFARQRAEKVAPDVTWEEPDLPVDADSAALTAWIEKHPRSFSGRRRLGARLVVEEKWTKAKEVLEKLVRLYPEYVGADNAYLLLAVVYRRLSDPAAEQKILEELAMRDGDASPAYLRLMELAEVAGDWAGMARNARRLLAVNPLIPTPYRFLARTALASGERDEAVTAYRALALLDDTDAAGVHYHLAKLLHQAGKPREARREVLRSLEEAPRFRDAHRLLLELVEQDPPPAASPPSSTRLPKASRR